MPCPISHVEWFVTDLERSCAFLEALFDWHFVVHSTHYRLYTPATGTCVGLMEVATTKPSESAVVYVQVDSIERALEQARQLGGRIATGRTAIPDYGWYAQLLDPDGNLIGLFER